MTTLTMDDLYQYLYLNENLYGSDFEKNLAREWNTWCFRIIDHLKTNPIITASSDPKDIMANECINCLVNVSAIPTQIRVSHGEHKNAFKKMKKHFDKRISEYLRVIRLAFPQIRDLDINIVVGARA